MFEVIFSDGSCFNAFTAMDTRSYLNRAQCCTKVSKHII
jgi:hypothetical protein